MVSNPVIVVVMSESRVVGCTFIYLHKMHGHPNIKFAIAKQAKETLAYKNIKRKLHRTTAAIRFNSI
jgi:hypothetical protein